ncbi:hypothetical protein WL22_04590 [Burkholderia ubonensis]|uniref:Uncharacterized protein n=1 Tax=Burkholderia ubonensis TaxID=101571 RepID=A0AAW3MI06_9BURK|nr:hypothetical protein WJ96_24985 [Burkholderia ubonensis]KVZ79323.1 hypothetical protein WL22_04590 [Burkholderia ubonensis]KVZ90228.1 hypothetical protein WL25_22150 [Burkholderia ubonensis]KWE29802.1 hypothetical protein WL75_03625 [Burkholderia ubonensis]
MVGGKCSQFPRQACGIREGILDWDEPLQYSVIAGSTIRAYGLKFISQFLPRWPLDPRAPSHYTRGGFYSLLQYVKDSHKRTFLGDRGALATIGS